jgi:hypothetical protein
MQSMSLGDQMLYLRGAHWDDGCLDSVTGKQLFAEALLDGTMEGFFKLIEQFRTQDEPAYCGLARSLFGLQNMPGIL